MNVVFTQTAWEQYTEWQKEDKKVVRRINDLIKDIGRNGLLAPGKVLFFLGKWQQNYFCLILQF